MDNGEYKEKLRSLLGEEVSGLIDRPKGSRHPKYFDMVYPINYGYLPDFLAPDGEGQDVYLLGVEEPVASFRGIVIAVIEREDDVEDKLVVVPKGMDYNEEEIEEAVCFQERYFKHRIVR